MFSTTCSHLKSICVRAAAPLLTMRETENIWRMPTRTSAMMVMARRTSTKLLPRREREPVRRSRKAPRSAILGHPRVRRVFDLLRDADGPDRVDAEHVARRRHQGLVDDVHVREDERGRPRDLPAAERVDRTPLKVAHEDARVVPAGGVVRPERRLHLSHVQIGKAELLVDASHALHDDVVLVDEEVRTGHCRRIRKAGREGAVPVRVSDEIDRHVPRRARRDERADLDEGPHVAALHLRERPLKQDLDVGGRALHLLAFPGPRDLASADDGDDPEDRDDRQQPDEAEPPPRARSGHPETGANEGKSNAHHAESAFPKARSVPQSGPDSQTTRGSDLTPGPLPADCPGRVGRFDTFRNTSCPATDDSRPARARPLGYDRRPWRRADGPREA